MRVFSWNINGVRSAAKTGFLEWLSYEKPEILCLQETRCLPSDLEVSLLAPYGYKSHWFSAEKKGYSGVALYTLLEPSNIIDGLGEKDFDQEGRVQLVEFGEFAILNCYFPNSRRDHSRLGYKLDFCQKISEVTQNFMKKKRRFLICGDFNIAHHEIDLANPRTNENNAGFLPQERAWMSEFLKLGVHDTFREFNKEAGHYTWWSNRPGVRERNIGWRIDYFISSPDLRENLKSAHIHPDVFGSDHCPVSVNIEF